MITANFAKYTFPSAGRETETVRSFNRTVDRVDDSGNLTRVCDGASMVDYSLAEYLNLGKLATSTPVINQGASASFAAKENLSSNVMTYGPVTLLFPWAGLATMGVGFCMKGVNAGLKMYGQTEILNATDALLQRYADIARRAQDPSSNLSALAVEAADLSQGFTGAVSKEDAKLMSRKLFDLLAGMQQRRIVARAGSGQD